MRGFAVVALVLGACSFKPGALPADGGPDGPPPTTVGFAKTTTLADEDSNVVSIRVVLSAPSDEAVSVAYTISGSTATKATDFTGADGLLTFAPGDVEEVIEVTILPDALEESDETADLQLSNVSNSNFALAIAMHTLTISANVLPRISFATTSTTSGEDSSPAIDVMLDKPAAVQATVNIVTSGTSTATGGGVDYDLSATSVTFAVGETSKQVTMTVTNDTLDEIDENAILSLDSPTAAILSATNTTRTHVIADNDLPPTVSFAAGPTSSIAEGATMVDLTVSLSTASGKDISVAFAVDGGSSATATADYTIGTTSPLSFPAGMTSKTIRVNVVQDTAGESNETVALTLGPLDTAIVTAGADTTHTLTITDDDGSCLGSGAYAACLATPSASQTITGTVNTDTDSRCMTPISGWTGQPSSCFIVGTSVTVSGATTVTGSKPLVLFSTGTIMVSANIDASSRRGGTNGPGANSAACGTYTDLPSNGGSGDGGGGGAGGSFRSAGGNGGNGGAGGASAGTALAAVGAPAVLRGGCAGEGGGNGNGSTTNGAAAGAGGGALYLVAATSITISTGVVVHANGAGAGQPGTYGGGSGGGSGGMIKLFTPSLTVTGAVLMANGGGGSQGGDNNGTGAVGSQPNPAQPTSPAPASSGGNGGGAGGAGFAVGSAADSGTSDSSDNGGGGGGGGGGHIESNQSTATAVVSAGP